MPLQAGDNTLTAVATDTLGHVAKDTATVTLDTSRPWPRVSANPTSVNPGCTATSGVWQKTCNDPNFTWSGASDGGSGVAGYDVYWGTSSSGTSPATWRTSASYNPSAVPSNSTYYLRVRTKDNVDNWSDWTPLFTLQYDGQPPLISDTTPANGSVITSAWPVISAALSDPQPGSGVQPLSTTLLLDSQVVTPQVNTANGLAYTPSVRLADGVHSVTAQVYDQAGNQAQSGPWSFTVDDDSASSLGVTKYYFHGTQRVAMRQDDVVYLIHSDHLGSTSLTTDITGTLVAETRYLPYGEERWITGTLVTDFTFTGQRAEAGFRLMDYNARYYDPGLGRFVSADTVVPQAGDPRALNRYAYVLGNPLRYTDPSGHQCAEGDMPCWEARWYKAHGYEYMDKEWVYTGNYFFSDLESAYQTIEDIVVGRHFLPESVNFTYNSFTFSLVQRGHDNALSGFFGSIGFAMDIVDTSVTASFAGLYTLEQILTASAGPGGAGAGFVVGEGAYLATGTFLLGVDLIGIFFGVGPADVLAGRTGIDFQHRQAYVGLDTLMSIDTMVISSGATYLIPVAPGVYIGLGGDILQLAYDFGRAAGFPGYSLQVQW